MSGRLARRILSNARAKGLRLATAESCTGGMVAAALTDIAGCSDVFDCGFVTYSNAAKSRLLGIKPDTLAQHGAVSEEVARDMAGGALAGSDADIAVAVTGIAGPSGGSAEKPVGTVCFAIAGKITGVFSQTRSFAPDSRSDVRALACQTALNLLAEAIAMSQEDKGSA